jgi:hypothetical protein
MSESSDAEFSKFFDDEAAKNARAIDEETKTVAIFREITAQLEQSGAFHLWDMDEEVQDQNRNATIAALELQTPEGDTDISDIKEQVARRLLNESAIVTAIAMIKIAKMDDLKPDQEAMYKKRLLAELQIREFDEGWQETVDQLLDGDALDLSKEDDLQLYLELVQKIEFPDEPSLVAAVRTIIHQGENDPESIQKISVVAPELIMHLSRVRREPAYQANAEEYIRYMRVSGLLSEQQVLALLDILYGSSNSDTKE